MALKLALGLGAASKFSTLEMSLPGGTPQDDLEPGMAAPAAFEGKTLGRQGIGISGQPGKFLLNKTQILQPEKSFTRVKTKKLDATRFCLFV